MTNSIDQIQHDGHLKKYLLALIGLSIGLGLLIVSFEKGHKINSFGDGLWWAVTTVTGVGYGDVVPVTGAGRLVGVVLMTAGLVLFSLIVAIFTSKITSRAEKYRNRRIKLQLDSINNKLYRLEHKLEYLIKDKSK